VNIVFIAPFAFSPKATVSARMLPMATALVRRGHRVTILIPPYDNPNDSGKRWSYKNVEIENAVIRHSPSVVRQYFDLARQLAKKTREIRPDVVHIFKPIGVGALAMWLLRNAFNLIVDNDDWEGRGGWVDVNPYSPLHKLFFIWQERWALRHPRAVTCASEALVERTRKLKTGEDRRMTNDLTSKPILLFPNGPDNTLREIVEQAQARRDSLRETFGWSNMFVVIYSGTIPLNHDLDLAVSALRDCPATQWVIVATGDGIFSLKNAIAQAGIGERVEWHGFMPHNQLVERLVAADVAIYPYRDTNINRAKCSGKVIDYMACGLPMVVSDVGMNRVYLEHERSGLLAPPGDARAFGTELKRLLDDKSLAQSLGKNARQRIWDKFGWDERIKVLEGLYLSKSNMPNNLS
jgi:glycosyltransferase involved in cell wall biosynthesis